MSKIERFLSDPRYQALDDAGKKEKLDLFFNKYVTQDARYSALDEAGKAGVYSKFMSKYAAPGSQLTKTENQSPMASMRQSLADAMSITQSAEASSTGLVETQTLDRRNKAYQKVMADREEALRIIDRERNLKQAIHQDRVAAGQQYIKKMESMQGAHEYPIKSQYTAAMERLQPNNYTNPTERQVAHEIVNKEKLDKAQREYQRIAERTASATPEERKEIAKSLAAQQTLIDYYATGMTAAEREAYQAGQEGRESFRMVKALGAGSIDLASGVYQLFNPDSKFARTIKAYSAGLLEQSGNPLEDAFAQVFYSMPMTLGYFMTSGIFGAAGTATKAAAIATKAGEVASLMHSVNINAYMTAKKHSDAISGYGSATAVPEGVFLAGSTAALVESAIEMLSDTAQAKIVLGQAKRIGRRGAEQIIKNSLRGKIAGYGTRLATGMAESAITEFTEEILQGASGMIFDVMSNQREVPSLEESFKEIMYSGAVGALGGITFGLGGGIMVQSSNYQNWREVKKQAASGNEHAARLWEARSILDKSNPNGEVTKSDVQRAYDVIKSDLHAVTENRYQEDNPSIVQAMAQMYDAYAMVDMIKSPQQEAVREAMQAGVQRVLDQKRSTAIQEPTQKAAATEPQSVEDTIVNLVQEGNIEAAENALNEAVKNRVTGINIPYLRNLVNESKADAERIAKEEADQKARRDIIDKYGEYADMSHSELQDEAKKRGLKASGKSTDIMARLKESDQAKPKAETTPAKPAAKKPFTANEPTEQQQDRAIKESLIAKETPKKASKYESMGYNAVQKEAKKRGINPFGVKKADLVRQIEEKDADTEKTNAKKASAYDNSAEIEGIVVGKSADEIKSALSAKLTELKKQGYTSFMFRGKEFSVQGHLDILARQAKDRAKEDKFLNSKSYKDFIDRTNQQNKAYKDMLAKAERKEPLTIAEAEGFATGVPKGYIKDGHMYIHKDSASAKVESVEPYSNRSKMNREALRNEKKARLRSLEEMKARGVKSVKIGAKQMTIDKAIDVTRKSMGISLLDEYNAEQKVSPILSEDVKWKIYKARKEFKGYVEAHSFRMSKKEFDNALRKLNALESEYGVPNTRADGTRGGDIYEQKDETPIEYTGKSDGKIDRNLVDAIKSGEAWMDYNATTSEEWNIAIAEMKEEGSFWGIKDQDIVGQGIKIMDDIDELLNQIDTIDSATTEYLDELDESGSHISDEEVHRISDENREKIKEIEAKIKVLQKKHKDLWDNAKAKPKLVKTEWRSKLEDVPHKIEGSIVARRSDWDKSLVSELSGREIVHVYWIDKGDGEVKPYGIQSAAKIMGWSKAETDRKIRQLANEHKAEEAKIKAWRSDAREHEGAASPRAALLTWEPLQAHKEQDFWAAIDRDFVFAHKDNTYRAIPKNQSEHIEAYRREGWDIQSTDQARQASVKAAEDSKAEGVEGDASVERAKPEAELNVLKKELADIYRTLSLLKEEYDRLLKIAPDDRTAEQDKRIEYIDDLSKIRTIRKSEIETEIAGYESQKSDKMMPKQQTADPVKAAEDIGSEVAPKIQSDPMSRSTFQEQYRQAQEGKLPKGQIDAQLKLYDAMMDTYAKEMGITIDEAYAQTIESVTGQEAGQPTPSEVAKEESGMRTQVDESYAPKKTKIAYKLFRTLKTRPGEIFPLFIGKSDPTPIGKWVKAEFIPTKGFQERPGWHLGFAPYAPHLRKADGSMDESRVWYEVEIPDDVDWQTKADATKTGDIRGEVPEGGYYTFKRPGAQGGEWKIAGAIKVIRSLSLEEVNRIKAEKGINDILYQSAQETTRYRAEPLILGDSHASPYRYMYPKVRGGWSKDKIKRTLMQSVLKHRSYGVLGVLDQIAKYDSADDFANHIFYHGTAGFIDDGLKPSIGLSARKVDPNSFGGGYGERYWSASVSRSKNVASSFSGTSSGVSVYPVLLKKGAKVISRPDIQDASEIEDIIVELWDQGVDAVVIGDWDDGYSEQELAIINPFAVYTYNNADHYRAFGKPRLNNLNAQEIRELYDRAIKMRGTGKDKDEIRRSIRFKLTIQGYIQKMPNGKYRIGIMQPNVTTGLHEQAHLGKSLMEIMANKSPAWASRLKAAEEWCGAKDGNWTTEAEEKFANGYVKFLADGSAPNGKLKTIFAKIKEWIGSILQGLADVKNLDVSNEMRGVYLAMLGISEGKRNLTSEQKIQSIKLKSAMKQDATSDPLKLETEIDRFADSNDLILEGKRTGNKTSFYLNRIDDGKTMIEIHHSNGEYEVNGYHAANNQEVMEQITRILGDTRYQTTDMPSAAEIAEAERQMAEVRAKYEGTEWHKSLPTWEAITRMNNVIDTPYDQKIKEGALFRDTHGDDPYIYETRYVNPKDYIDKVHLEGETYDKVVSMPTTQKYIEWYKQGYEPPPVSLVVHYKNGLVPTERRRWVAAIEAGVKKVPALVEIGRASEMPNHPGYLKAPNGKKTNLNERQWLQVRTENFKKWFGDWENDPKNASKVVEKKTSSRDANGEPMPMYHGTIYDFTEFKANMPTHNTDMFGRGYETKRNAIFFADNPINSLPFTNKYGDKNGFTVGGRTIPVFLNIKNPFYANDEHTDAEYESLRELGYTKYDVDNIGWGYLDDELGDKFVSDLQKLGYDGIILNDEHPDTGDIVTSYAVFTPNQIKSATANVGTFSESNDIRYQIDNAIQSASPDMQDRIAKIMEKQKKVQQAANVTYRELAARIGRTTSVYEWDSMMRKSLVTAIRKAFPGAAPMNIEKYAALEETLGELDPGLEDHAKEIKKIKAQLRRMVAMDKKFREALEDVSGFSDIADIPFEGLFSALENTNPSAYDSYFRDETFEVLLKALPRIKKSFGEQFTMQTLQRIVDVTLNGSDPAVGRAEFELAFVQPHRVLAELFGKAGIKTINYAYNGTLAVAAYENEYAQHLTEINRLLMTADNNRGSAYEGDDLDIIGRTIFEVDGNSEITDKLETIQARLAEWAENNNAIINPNDVDGIYKAKEYLKDTMRGFIAEWNANPEHERKIGIREDYDNPRKYNWGTASDITTKRGKYLYTPGNARARSKQDFSEGLNYETNIFSAYSNYMYAMTRYMAFYDLANYVEDSSVLYPSKGKVGQKKIASGFDLDLSLAQRKSSAYASGMVESYVKNVIGYHKKDTPMGRLVKSARTNVYSSMLAANIAMTVLNYNQRNLIHAVVDQSIAMQVKKDIAFWTGLFSPSNEEYPVLSGIMQAYVTANQSLIAELSAEAKRYANEGRTALTRAYYRHTAKNAELLRLSPFSLAELGNRAYAHAAGVYQITQNSEAYKNYTASGMSRHRAMEKALAEDSSLRRAAITYGGILNAEINADANRAFSPYFFSGASKTNSLAIFIRYGVTISLLELRTYGGARDIRSLLSPDLFKLLTSGNVKAATAAQTIQAGVIMKSMLDQKRIAELVRRGDISTAKTSKNLITVEQVNMVREAITWALDEQAKHTTEEYHAIIRGKRGARQAMAALMAFSISEVILRSAIELLFSLIPWWLGKKKFIETDVIENVAAVFGLFQTTKTMANVRLGSTLAPDLGAYNPTAKTTTKALSQYVLRLTPYAGLANYMGKVFTGKYFSDIFWDEVYD